MEWESANTNVRTWSILRITAEMMMLLSMILSVSSSQSKPTVAGGAVLTEIPIGTLHDRFLGSAGVMVFAGVETDSRLTWLGKFEYAEFNSVNSDKVNKTVTIGSGIGAQKILLPLPKISLELRTAALTAEAQLGLARSEFADVNGVLGFGFSHWVNTRGAYYDSLFTMDANGAPVKAAVLAVPAIRQEDWSGVFNLGLDLNMKVFEPFWFTAGADYKLIVGELWQSLDLDLENVAGMQFLSLRAGVKVIF